MTGRYSLTRAAVCNAFAGSESESFYFFAIRRSTGDINTATPRVCHNHRVPGEIKRREVEPDPQPRRDHEQGGGAGLRKLDFFRLGLFLNSSATDIVTLPKHGS